MFAIGKPGGPPRILYQAESGEAAAQHMMDGEVAIPVAGAGAYIISADGTSATPVLPTVADLWMAVRGRRGALLTACDWTQLPDVPQATRDAWTSYRQALRDITTQPDPAKITWPTAPTNAQAQE